MLKQCKLTSAGAELLESCSRLFGPGAISARPVFVERRMQFLTHLGRTSRYGSPSGGPAFARGLAHSSVRSARVSAEARSAERLDCATTERATAEYDAQCESMIWRTTMSTKTFSNKRKHSSSRELAC